MGWRPKDRRHSCRRPAPKGRAPDHKNVVIPRLGADDDGMAPRRRANALNIKSGLWTGRKMLLNW